MYVAASHGVPLFAHDVIPLSLTELRIYAPYEESNVSYAFALTALVGK